MRGTAIYIAAAMTCLLGNAARAQTAPSDADNSGTNPTTISRSLGIVNEYQRFPSERWANTTSLRYNEPLFGGSAGLRLAIPYKWTDIPGRTFDGFGDASIKATWVTYLDRRQGVVFTGEVYAPSASDRVLGTGRWVGAPGVTYAYFLSPEVIIAPALIYNFSFSGNEQRQNVSRFDFDFYTVYKPKGQNWWLTSDLTISRDLMAKTTPMAWRVALGTTVAKLPGGGAVNLSIRPGVGFGADRPVKWSLEVGLTAVGF